MLPFPFGKPRVHPLAERSGDIGGLVYNVFDLVWIVFQVVEFIPAVLPKDIFVKINADIEQPIVTLVVVGGVSLFHIRDSYFR